MYFGTCEVGFVH